MAEWHEGYNKATEHTHDTLDDLGVPRHGEDGATLYIHQRIRAYGDKRARGAVEASFAQGVNTAADWIAKRRADFIEAHGNIDPSTGALEFGRGQHAELKAEYVGELEEIEEAIRALASPSPDMLEKRNDVA